MSSSRARLVQLVTKAEPMPRRTFFGAVGWSGLLVSLGAISAASIRFMFPNVLFEPPTAFKVGRPELFPDGATFLSDQRVFIFKVGGGFHAVSAICTHLGCTVKKAGAGFNCPCHGSKFDQDGRVLSGPAPRPLEWFEVKLAADGQLLVDSGVKVKAGFSFKV